MDKFSLTSALIGGLIAAILSYIAQTIRYLHAEKSKQKRLAFLYMVRMSEIIAIKRAVEIIFKDIFDNVKAKINLEKDPLSLYYVFYGLSEALRNDKKKELFADIDKEKLKLGASFLKVIEAKEDDTFSFKVSEELVSNFPEEAILHYHFFVRYIKELRQNITMWILAIESTDFSCFTPSILHGQYNNFR